MTKHTPGPWFAVDGHHTPWTEALLIGTDPEGMEAVAHTTRGFGAPTQWANARLIAAAPEMYEALERLEARAATGDLGPLLRDEISAARRALYKARGESPPSEMED